MSKRRWPGFPTVGVSRHFVALLLIAGSASIAASPVFAGDLSISNPWFRFIIPSVPAAGYFTLTNAGHEARVLTGASSPACGTLVMHKSMSADGEDQMVMVKSLDVPPNGAVTFGPGGYHLMCTEPTKDMKVGARVPVTLTFADGTKLSQDFSVHGISGQ
ncbi:MAG: copper chaperone PCu(A)C [Methylovirgula sp.]